MRNLYVISDVHGDYSALKSVMLDTGLLIEKPGRGLVRKRDAFVVQIGDLANCVRESRDDDLRCLATVGDWIDCMLVGNHEIPYFDPENTFVGFQSYGEIHQKLWELHEAKLIAPACESNGTLITHAGVSLSQINITSAHLAQEPLVEWTLNKLLHEWESANFQHSLFRDCGRARYGRAPIGGMLWCDFDKEFEPTPFPQIVGHSAGVLRQKGNAICIDTQITTGKPTVLRVL